jgi:hypothetical protein
MRYLVCLVLLSALFAASFAQAEDAFFVRGVIPGDAREYRLRTYYDGDNHPCTQYDDAGFPHMVACGVPTVVHPGSGKWKGYDCFSESPDDSEFVCWPKSCGCTSDANDLYRTVCKVDADMDHEPTSCAEAPFVSASDVGLKKTKK